MKRTSLSKLIRRDAATQLPESICALPWLNLSLDVDGTSRPCCKFAHQTAESPYQMANLQNSTLEEVWNSEGMQKLRRDFLAGIKPAECSTCWDEEAGGVVSLRQTFAEYRGMNGAIDYDEMAPETPRALDLKLSSACNLKCRICGPVASSLWLQEELSVKEPKPGSFIAELAEQRTYYLSNKITRHPANLDTIRKWLPHLQYLELTGGEPMLSPENRELIELIDEEGFPEQVGILFNTNATIIDDRILRHLGNFREVKICLSIDDLGDRFEYERAPARWDVVTTNLDRYQSVAGDAWKLYAFCSVSLLNVWYLPEYLTWLSSRADRTPLEFVLNLVHYPRHFSVQVLPEQTKTAVRARLTAEVLDNKDLSDDVRQAVRQLVDFMGHERNDDAEQFRAGVAEIVERDGIRGEHYARVFPEFTAELKRSGGWPD